MTRIYRQEIIKLNNAANEEDFIAFMQKIFIPFFVTAPRRPSRLIYTGELKEQILFKETKVPMQYVWSTVWTEDSSELKHKSFEQGQDVWNSVIRSVENLRYSNTEEMYSKLDAFRSNETSATQNESGDSEVVSIWASIEETT